jgi:hypothetical protein
LKKLLKESHKVDEPIDEDEGLKQATANTVVH